MATQLDIELLFSGIGTGKLMPLFNGSGSHYSVGFREYGQWGPVGETEFAIPDGDNDFAGIGIGAKHHAFNGRGCNGCVKQYPVGIDQRKSI